MPNAEPKPEPSAGDAARRSWLNPADRLEASIAFGAIDPGGCIFVTPEGEAFFGGAASAFATERVVFAAIFFARFTASVG